MINNPEIVTAIAAHAAEAAPAECCGFVIAGADKKRLRVMRARNVAAKPLVNWRIHVDDQQAAEEAGEIVAVYHSHVNARAIASEADKVSCEASGYKFLIYSHPLGELTEIVPCGYKAPLIGREFVHGVTDCYAAIRDDYFEHDGIELPDFPREDKWWEIENGPDLYMEHIRDPANGFTIIGTDWRKAQPRDLLLMRLFSKHGRVNHSAILLDGMRLFHHVPNRLSGRETFSQFWQQCVAYVARHEKFLKP